MQLNKCLFNENSIYVKMAKEKMRLENKVSITKTSSIPIINYDSVELLLNVFDIHENHAKKMEKYLKRK